MDAPDAAEQPWAEAAEDRVLTAAIGLAPQIGWGRGLAARAAAQAGLSAADAALLLPGGARDLAALLSRRHDAQALAALAEVDPLSLKVRERIRRAVEARVRAAADDEAATRRCAAWLALPLNLPLALSLLWESADVLWRWAGDTATDENHYSKRAILSGVLASTIGVRFERGETAASEHLAAQIERVMSFEKWKAGLPKPSETLQAVAAALGRMRYGAAEAAVTPKEP
jgi:ubiquinone biosynthesis protein COQ9